MKMILFIIALILFIGCKHKISEGNIVNKRYEESRTYVMVMPVYTGKSYIYIPYIIHDNADYVITVKGIYNGAEKKEKFYIEKHQFDTLKINDFVCVNEMCNKDENNKKVKK